MTLRTDASPEFPFFSVFQQTVSSSGRALKE